jgi:hypothetical protein
MALAGLVLHFLDRRTEDTLRRTASIPTKNPGFLLDSGVLRDFLLIDRGGARTLDQRINLPHRLSPTATIRALVTLTCAAFESRVESLDYTIAIAGVPRLVSEAEADQGPVSCLLITQSARFSNRRACRYRLRCGARGSQGVPAYCGIHSSRFGFFPREAPELGSPFVPTLLL